MNPHFNLTRTVCHLALCLEVEWLPPFSFFNSCKKITFIKEKTRHISKPPKECLGEYYGSLWKSFVFRNDGWPNLYMQCMWQQDLRFKSTSVLVKNFIKKLVSIKDQSSVLNCLWLAWNPYLGSSDVAAHENYWIAII